MTEAHQTNRCVEGPSSRRRADCCQPSFNSSAQAGKNGQATGRAKRAAMFRDEHRTLKRLLSADRAPRSPA